MARDEGDQPPSDIVDDLPLQVLRVLAPSSKFRERLRLAM
jgi:hypothetical protein